MNKVTTRAEHPLEVDCEEGTCSRFTDVELEFMGARIETPEIRTLLETWARDPDRLMTVAVCFPDPAASMAVALYLPEELFNSTHTAESGDFSREIPILVNQQIPFHTRTNRIDGYRNVYPFGMIEDCYDLELNNLLMPKLVHYLYQVATNYGQNAPSGDVDPAKLDLEWRKLDLEKKWSNRYFADHIPTKCRIMERDLGNSGTPWAALTEEQVTLMAQIEHNRWVVERLLSGFAPATEEEKQTLRDAKIAYEQSGEDAALEKVRDDLKNKIQKNRHHNCIDELSRLLPSEQEYNRVMCKYMGWVMEQGKALSSRL